MLSLQKICWRNKWGCKCREAWVGCRTMQRGTAALTAEWIMLRTSLSLIANIEHFHIHLLYQKGHISLYYHILYIWSVLIYSQVQLSGPWWLIPMPEDAINSALEIFSQLSPFLGETGTAASMAQRRLCRIVGDVRRKKERGPAVTNSLERPDAPCLIFGNITFAPCCAATHSTKLHLTHQYYTQLRHTICSCTGCHTELFCKFRHQLVIFC